MKMQVELQAWSVPNFVRQKMQPGKRQDGFQESPAISLRDVPENTLAAMCDEFRKEIFRKAGKPDPTPQSDKE